MNIEEFRTYIKNNFSLIDESISKEDIRFKTINKNNGTSYEGLLIQKENTNISPVINLNNYFRDTLTEMDMSNILKEIAFTLKEASHNKINLDYIADFNQVKEDLSFKVINANANKDLLKTLPHRIVNDFAIIYKIELPAVEHVGEASFNLTTNLMKQYHMTEQDLYTAATYNASKKSPAQLTSMENTLQSLFLGESEVTNLLALSFDEMKQQDRIDEQMYVLTNKNGVHGANTLFYPDTLDNVFKFLQKDFVVLPSSIHEVIIIPINKKINEEELTKMVKEINATEVASDEILANQAYSYDGTAKQICPLKEYEVTKTKGMQRREEIFKELKRAGLKPNEKLIHSMHSLDRELNKKATLKDVEKMGNESKATPKATIVIKESLRQLHIMEMDVGLEP